MRISCSWLLILTESSKSNFSWEIISSFCFKFRAADSSSSISFPRASLSAFNESRRSSFLEFSSIRLSNWVERSVYAFSLSTSSLESSSFLARFSDNSTSRAFSWDRISARDCVDASNSALFSSNKTSFSLNISMSDSNDRMRLPLTEISSRWELSSWVSASILDEACDRWDSFSLVFVSSCLALANNFLHLSVRRSLLALARSRSAITVWTSAPCWETNWL